MGVLNKTIIPLALVGYEFGYATGRYALRWLSTISYPTHIRGEIVKSIRAFCVWVKENVFSAELTLRWLNWIFLGGYLPSLSINYVAMSKDMGKSLPQLYYTKMKMSYDLGFIAIGVAMAT